MSIDTCYICGQSFDTDHGCGEYKDDKYYCEDCMAEIEYTHTKPKWKVNYINVLAK